MNQQDYFTYRKEMAELKKRLKTLSHHSNEYRAVMREITHRKRNYTKNHYVTLKEKMVRSLGQNRTEIKDALTDITENIAKIQ